MSLAVLKVQKEGGAFGALTDRTLAGLRLILSVSALVIIIIDPTEPSRLETLTHLALIAYILYSICVFFFARRHGNFSLQVMQYVIWTDVLWYSAFMTFSAGTNAVFFFFYLFAIIEGSSRGGTRLGLTLTAVCTAVFLALNFLFVVPLQLDVPRFARRAVYMAALGYILAYWGGAEAILRRKLTFLKELSLISNPRFGVDRTIRQMLCRLQDYYQADYCFLLIGGTDGGMDFYRVSGDSRHSESGGPMKVSAHAGIPLMNNSDPVASAFVKRISRWQNRPRYLSCDTDTDAVTELPIKPAADAAELLNVRSFITAPLRHGDRVRGRMLVGSANPSRFVIQDAVFLQQAADLVLPLIENLRLVDHLASDAADGERRKIARSVHDRVIQPYLGLQIGLKALQQEIVRSAWNPGMGRTNREIALLEELIAMTKDGIEELRQYVTGLKNSHIEDTKLVDFIRRFAGKFEGTTGIHVEVVDGACGLTMNDRLSAEVFQMTAEALSNVHRHTRSRNVEVRLTVVDSSLQLSVENEADEASHSFTPASITERAAALGAHAEVLRPIGKTLLRVEVPL